ncbi:MAG TPA: rubredoxin [Microscillaceae bacterium]|nr:rubredoxin [Microscillaceae bacterium]
MDKEAILENSIQDLKARKQQLMRVFVKGGIISPGDLLKVIDISNKLGNKYVHFGSRQDILFPATEHSRERLQEIFEPIQADYYFADEEYQNIMSSYVALDVMPNRQWLAPHIYHYILESFTYQPRLKVNLVDPLQSLVPLFTGNINFIASSIPDYWYLYLRLDQFSTKPWRFPHLIYGLDIARISQAIEEIVHTEAFDNYVELHQKINERIKVHTQKIKEDLIYPAANFPYYEGMNRIEEGKYWLGLYWRNNKFNSAFLKGLCELCLETKIGKISLTPWKSFIVHGILEKDRFAWEKLLGKFGINMRHSSLELNWHLPVLDEEALELKNYLVRVLDQQDISTYGLTFTINTQQDVVLFTSVVIEKNPRQGANEPDTYNILYSKDFNPNLSEYFYYAKNIHTEIIPPLLMELSRMYYDQLESPENTLDQTTYSREEQKTKLIFQCTNCMTIYDEDFGDELAGIAKGIPFAQLPPDYCCSLCGSPKSSFRQVT